MIKEHSGEMNLHGHFARGRCKAQISLFTSKGFYFVLGVVCGYKQNCGACKCVHITQMYFSKQPSHDNQEDAYKGLQTQLEAFDHIGFKFTGWHNLDEKPISCYYKEFSACSFCVSEILPSRIFVQQSLNEQPQVSLEQFHSMVVFVQLSVEQKGLQQLSLLTIRQFEEYLCANTELSSHEFEKNKQLYRIAALAIITTSLDFLDTIFDQ